MRLRQVIPLLMMNLLMAVCSAGNFYEDFFINWGHDKVKIEENGQLLTLVLDQLSGSGFESKNEFLFGKIDMQLKLVPGNSAGTVTAYYLSSKGSNWDEIDFEFLGNLSGEPYIVHTNVYTQGKGDREQQFYLWFDPTAHFHTYSILWNRHHIVFSIDGIPIREFKNLESIGIPFPNRQPMKIYSSLWNADNWATRGGLVKIDWTQSPFHASYTNFTASTCTSCYSQSQGLDFARQGQLQWVQDNFMIYNYCKDAKRFPQGLPLECHLSN